MAPSKASKQKKSAAAAKNGEQLELQSITSDQTILTQSTLSSMIQQFSNVTCLETNDVPTMIFISTSSDTASSNKRKTRTSAAASVSAAEAASIDSKEAKRQCMDHAGNTRLERINAKKG